MRSARLGLGLLGLAAGVWGVWLLRDDGPERLLSTGLWLAGGIIAHDFVLAPAVVAVGFVAAKILPDHHRAVGAVAFLVWGTVTVAVVNVLMGEGGKADNETLLNRPYVGAWLSLTAVAVVAAIVSAVIVTRRRQRSEA